MENFELADYSDAFDEKTQMVSGKVIAKMNDSGVDYIVIKVNNDCNYAEENQIKKGSLIAIYYNDLNKCWKPDCAGQVKFILDAYGIDSKGYVIADI